MSVAEADRVLEPANAEDLSSMIRDADGPLRIVGGDTRGLAPSSGSTLSMAGLTGIVDYVPEALTLIARAGTPLTEVAEVLAKGGQRLTFEPPDWRGLTGATGTPTLGGAVSANLSGPRAVSMRSPRHDVLGLRFVDGSGTALTTGGRVMKNVTGLDLARGITGARGRMGVITEITLRVQSIPEAAETIVARGLTMEEAVAAMSAAMATPFDVTGAARDADGSTYLRVEGFAASARDRSGRLAGHLGSFGTWESAGDAAWDAIRDLSALAGDEIWIVRCRPSQAAGIAAASGATHAIADMAGARLYLAFEPGSVGEGTLPKGLRAARIGAPGRAAPDPVIAGLEEGMMARFDPRGILNSGT